MEARGHAEAAERVQQAMALAQKQLATAQHEAVQHKTEAQTLRALVDQFRPADKVDRVKKTKAS